MQIRRQLRNLALAVATNPNEYPICCRERVCMSGYHGRLGKIRFKARPQSHGNKTGQSKRVR